MPKQSEQSKPLREDQIISELPQISKRWPKTLWLFADGNAISVMRLNEKGERAMMKMGGGVDPAYEVARLNIPNDGGDW